MLWVDAKLYFCSLIFFLVTNPSVLTTFGIRQGYLHPYCQAKGAQQGPVCRRPPPGLQDLETSPSLASSHRPEYSDGPAWLQGARNVDLFWKTSSQGQIRERKTGAAIVCLEDRAARGIPGAVLSKASTLGFHPGFIWVQCPTWILFSYC